MPVREYSQRLFVCIVIVLLSFISSEFCVYLLLKMETDLLECLEVGTATQEMLASYDASSLVTPDTFDEWCKEQEPPSDDGMDDKVDAACTKMLEDIEKRQKSNEKINIISNVVLKEAQTQNNKDRSVLEQLLSTPRSKTTSKGQFYKMSNDEKKEKKRKFEFKKPLVPVAAPDWLQAEWAKESKSKVTKPPKPLTPKVTIIEGPQTSTTENGKQISNKENEKPPKKRRCERKIARITTEKPSWVDDFSQSQKNQVVAAFEIRNSLVEKLKKRECDLKKYLDELTELNKNITSVKEDVVTCKKLLNHFSNFSYNGE